MTASLDEYPQLIVELSRRSTPVKITEDAILVCLIILAFVGNVLVCIAVFKTAHLRTIPNMFITNLAVSDILMAIVCMPVSLHVLISGKWPFSSSVCDMHGFFMFTFGIVSQVNVSVVAVNRYFALCRPFQCKAIFTKRNVLFMIAILWILPSVASVPPLVGWGYYAFHPGKALCIYPFHVNMIYTTIVQLLFIAFPMGLIVFSYTNCILAIRSSNRQIAEMSDDPTTVGQGSRKAREVRATWTMLFSTLGFSMCWLPVSVIDFIETSRGGGNLPRQVFMLNGFLIFLSSTINPFIYWLSNRDFRKAFREVIRFGFKRNEIMVGEMLHSTQSTAVQSLG
ncbi:unnamed protein product [Porites evermanni]|uniref:G-protein coupled receptors family 1 profile domain-containing protein n=1 Tax=Porites evermanni TaxID=104178 RepID=A0ABN8PLA7_9CNID|nr:unnamed protein product [Porites evermanni]